MKYVSQNNLIDSLVDSGLSKLDAKIYVYLVRRGPKKANEITSYLESSKQQIYPCLKNLQSKGLISSTLERPAKFSAMQFDKVLDALVGAKLNEAKTLQQQKDLLLEDWQSIIIKEKKDCAPRFSVIEGRKYIYSKMQQMIQETKRQLSTIANVPSLLRAEQYGLLDVAFTRQSKSKVRFKFLTEIDDSNLVFMKKLLHKTSRRGFKVYGRNPDVGINFAPQMVIRDNEELLFFTSSRSEPHETCILTNCAELIKSFMAVFDNLWKYSTPIEQKVLETETGVLPQRTLIIEEAEEAQAKAIDAMEKAKENITIVTSSEEILHYQKTPSLLKKLANKGISIKIMAPISRKNLKACLDLAAFCEVRHISNEYNKTIIVDNNHLFQFKIPHSNEKGNNVQYLSQTLYSSDFEYIYKTKKMLLDIWNNSVIPSSSTVETILEGIALSESPAKRKTKYKFTHKLYTTLQLHDNADKTGITEQDVISKILNYKKNPGTISGNTICGFSGHALIHSHETLDSDDLYIAAYHMDEESTYGSEDAIIVMSWLNTPKGFKFVPLAIVGNNPNASESWKRIYQDPFAPASRNYYLFNNEEVQIQMHGNTFFAGWTKSIPVQPKRSLPPSAIILEATGTIRSYDDEMTFSNGVKFNRQQNCYDSFVTMVNKKTKYQGPATDGLLIREFYQDIIQPKQIK